MCNEESMNCVNLNLQAFECFHSLFLGVNVQEGNLLLNPEDGSIQIVKNFAQMQGINTIWKIAIYCRNERVRELSRECLCDVFLLFKCKAQKDRIKIQDQFLKSCIKSFVTAYD